MRYVNKKYGIGLRTYEDLHRWSVDAETFQDFWEDAYAWLGVGSDNLGDVGPMLREVAGPYRELRDRHD